VQLVERFSLVDALDEGAPTGALEYMELLAEALEDGVLTLQEAEGLGEVARLHSLDIAAVEATHEAFVLALAHEALTDGKVSRAERAELTAVAALLNVNARALPHLLTRAEHARHARLSQGLKELPENWPHGEPLRVGDKVTFTGCNPDLRAGLEERAEALGVRVLGNVSPKTAMLVTDGTMDGTKAARARELGTRVVHPNTFATLLTYLQPAVPRTSVVSPPRETPRAPGGTGTTVPPTGLGDGESSVVSAAHPYDDAAGSRVDPAKVRAWAIANGYEVGVRGRLPRPILDAYNRDAGDGT
jgi:DNA polymerase-3 subunit epsilon